MIGRDGPAALIDLARYPIDGLSGPAGRQLVAEARAQLAARGACVPGFVRPAALATLAAEAAAVAPRAFYKDYALYCYSEEPDPSLPAEHPRRSRVGNLYGFAGYDLVPQDAGLRRLYECDLLTRFVAALLGTEELYRYADPIAALTISVMGEGGHQGWHFDCNDFIVSVLLQKPERGGAFEFVPMIRSPSEENYDRVARVLAGERDGVQSLPLEEGTLVLFQGRNSLHRVTRVEGGRKRLIVLLAYDRRPGQLEPEDNLRVVYGRGRGEPPGPAP
jgi:hypothetical protein